MRNHIKHIIDIAIHGYLPGFCLFNLNEFECITHDKKIVNALKELQLSFEPTLGHNNWLSGYCKIRASNLDILSADRLVKAISFADILAINDDEQSIADLAGYADLSFFCEQFKGPEANIIHLKVKNKDIAIQDKLDDILNNPKATLKFTANICNCFCNYIFACVNSSGHWLHAHFLNYVKKVGLDNILAVKQKQRAKDDNDLEYVVSDEVDKVVQTYFLNLVKAYELPIKLDFSNCPKIETLAQESWQFNNRVKPLQNNNKLHVSDLFTECYVDSDAVVCQYSSRDIFKLLLILDFFKYVEENTSPKAITYIKLGNFIEKDGKKSVKVQLSRFLRAFITLSTLGHTTLLLSNDVIDRFSYRSVYSYTKHFCDFIKTDARGRLHNFEGPACGNIGAPSTYIYAIEGIRLPEWVFNTDPQKITANIILNEENAEIRRILIQKFGITKLLELAKKIDANYGYELVEIPLQQIGEPGEGRLSGFTGSYLVMKNPSTGTMHVEGVSNECQTVEEAICWRNNISIHSLISKDANFARSIQISPIKCVYDPYHEDRVDYYQQGDVLIFPNDGPRDQFGRIQVNLIAKVIT